MVSLNQIDKVKELQTQGWVVVPRSSPETKLGGPVLMRKGDEFVLVYASSEIVKPTPDEIASW